MTAYYNEHDHYAADWLENLIAEGLIPWGDVDRRSIVDVSADDLKDYKQVHLFAGIGGWPLALRIAGISDDNPVWTGSCPCQPFSQAGKQKGHEDERHLWPYMWRLVAERDPAVVFGEQVASALGRGWLAGVRASLEILGRRVGAADLCAAGVGSPNIRQRLWWVADDEVERRGQRSANTGRCGEGAGAQEERLRLAVSGEFSGLGDPDHARSQGRGDRAGEGGGADQRLAWPAGQFDFWSRYDVVHCTDGKARRFEPGSFPLAHGVFNRVGRLRAYGNAINPWLAAEFIRSYYDGLSLG